MSVFFCFVIIVTFMGLVLNLGFKTLSCLAYTQQLISWYILLFSVVLVQDVLCIWYC